VAVRETTRAEARHSFLLWFGVLAAPLAWFAQIVIAPDIAEIVCLPGAEGSGRGEVYGFAVETFVLTVTVASTVVGVAALAASVRCLRVLKRAGDDTPGRRATWMAFAGVLVSTLFVLSIAVGYIPLFFLESCVTPL
jgi:hypothetical protein